MACGIFAHNACVRHVPPYLTWLQVVKLYYQGWDKLRISCFLQVSRSTVDTWIARFEAEHFAGLMNTKRGHKEPPPTMSDCHGWCRYIIS